MLLGLIPGAGGTQRLPRLAGAKMALEMCTDGKPVPAPKALAAGIIDHIVDGDLLSGAIAFAKGKAAARDIRKVRDIVIPADGVKAGLEACDAMRASLKKTARGMRAPYASVDAIEAGTEAAVRPGLGPRARDLRRVRRLDRVEGAAASVLRRSRGRQGAGRAEGHAGEGDQARRGRRRRARWAAASR